MIYSFSFNGKRKDFIYCDDEKGKRYSAFAPVTRNLLKIPGMKGAHLINTDTKVRVIQQPVFYSGSSKEDLKKLEEEIAEWLILDEAAPLIFDDEKDRIYYGLVEGSLDIEELLNVGEGTLTFVCPDPYKYGVEKTAILNTDTGTIINVEGTEKTKPIIEIDVLAPITFAMVSNGEEYMMIGKPVPADQTPVSRYSSSLINNCDSLVGWANGTSIDGISGSIVSENGKFKASDYGTGSNWHGPAIKHSLPTPLQDFNVQAEIEFNEVKADEMGRIQVYLLDVNNVIVAWLSFFDTYNNYFDKVGRATMGGINNKNVVSDRGTNWTGFFTGRLAIQRKGQEIVAKISEYDTYNKVYKDSIEGKLIDYQNEFQAPITQIQVHLGVYGSYPAPHMAVDSIQVLEVNDLLENQIPFIADAGDKVKFDFKNHEIWLNGEMRKDLKDRGATPFSLKPGENKIALLPESGLSGVMKYRPAYK